MVKEPITTSAALIPVRPTPSKLRDAAQGCKACDLWKSGTQTVFGVGSSHANVMLVGEQPGDREDLAGRPFVGPAGLLLDKALAEAGIDRSQVYVTNVVKHFKWEPRGKRRIHKKPNSLEIAACRPWLDAEIAVTKPQVIVCLGATAAQALLGKSFKVTQHRSWPPNLRHLSPRRCIHRQFCARLMTKRGMKRCASLSRICERWQKSCERRLRRPRNYVLY